MKIKELFAIKDNCKKITFSHMALNGSIYRTIVLNDGKYYMEESYIGGPANFQDYRGSAVEVEITSNVAEVILKSLENDDDEYDFDWSFCFGEEYWTEKINKKQKETINSEILKKLNTNAY